jgi:ribonuclease-3
VTATLAGLQDRLGHRFRDAALLDRALTHRSHGLQHNERLEFLGDAVLTAAVSGLLYAQRAQSDEGALTRVRAHLVREAMLHRLALELDLPTLLRLSEGEARSGGAQRASILADALEALIGAVYLDGGFEAAQAMVTRLFEPLLDATAAESATRDPKTELQEWLQARRQPVPAYAIEATRGRPHEQTFVVTCRMPALGVEVRGEGRSRRAAEQEAARAALATLKSKDTPAA